MAARLEYAAYRRNARIVTTEEVLHPDEKAATVAALPRLRRKRGGEELRAGWAAVEARARTEATEVVADYEAGAAALRDALGDLARLRAPELIGKADGERQRAVAALTLLHDAAAALATGDFGAAGSAVEVAARDLAATGGKLVLSLNAALSQAALSRASRDALQHGLAERRAARAELDTARGGAPRDVAAALRRWCEEEADGYRAAAEALAGRVGRAAPVRPGDARRERGPRVVAPQDLETFADVGGLEDVKELLRATVGAILDRPDQAAKYRVVHNGILFHGPPGTGKTLLSRALAGEYGLRYIRFSPATIASSYIHEAAKNLGKLFETARQNAPCLLFLDEVDTIASDRGDQPSADHREVVTQLMNSLEEYRAVPGLVICAATNDIDRLDPGLREGRFDTKVLVPLPDAEARADIVRVHLDGRGDAVDWTGIDLGDLAERTSGRNAAAIEAFVSRAAQGALQADTPITMDLLVAAIGEREGKDRTTLDERLTWDDVVLPEETGQSLREILNVFAHPDVARQLGVTPPAGILLHGPPGTGKTTVAKVMASEISASFYEMSAADLMSKWAGESEQRVARLFAKARANRPTIVFIDEIDSLLRRRSSTSSAAWEERVVSQFLRELDGLVAGQGVLLVGATNRPDIVDDAIVRRRLTPVEVGLPDRAGRLALLRVLTKDMSLTKDVDLAEIAAMCDGMSGADLKLLRNTAGMKALTRVTSGRGKSRPPAVSRADFVAALAAQTHQSTLLLT